MGVRPLPRVPNDNWLGTIIGLIALLFVRIVHVGVNGQAFRSRRHNT